MNPARIILLLGLLLSDATLAIPIIQHWETAQGTRVYFVPAPELPIVDVEVTLDAGSARDADQAGLATLTNSLLEEGAGGRSADQIAEQFENLGAQFANSVDRDKASVSLRSLSEPALLQPALETLALVLARPDIEETTFERVRQQMLANLKYQEQAPEEIADNAFYKAIFATHPYAVSPAGTLASVTALTREEVKAFHARYYVAKNAIVAIVGALTRSAAEKLATTVVNLLPTGQAAPPLPPVNELSEAKTIHLPHPATQTHILLGQPGLAWGEPDYFTLYVGNYILGGGGFVSRLTMEMRENRGLAYTVYSYFSPLRVAGPFTAGLQTRNDQAMQALPMVQEILRKFVEAGPTPQEVKEAKQGITGMFPLRIKSNRNILAYLSIIGFYQLPLDYLQTFNKNVEAVTDEMIKDAFKRKLHLDKLVTVTVGGEPNK